MNEAFNLWCGAGCWLLLDAALRSTVFLAAIGIVVAAWRPRNANVAHRMWTFALFAMLAMPLIAPLAPRVPLPAGLFHLSQETAARVERAPAEFANVTTTLETPVITPQMPVFAPLTADETPAPQHDAVETIDASSVPRTRWIGVPILAIYLTGALLLGVRLALGLLRTRRVISRAHPVAWPASRLLEAGSTALLASDDLRVPVTVGFVRRAVLLPSDWQSWDPQLLHSVLAHELEHVRRRDAAVSLVAALNCTLNWFHPGAWWLRRRLADLAEQACDDAVISINDNRASYARHLLQIAARAGLGRKSPQAIGVAMARTPQVEKRIDAIIDADRPLARRLSPAAAFATACIALPLVLVAAGLRNADAQVQPAPAPQAAPVPQPAPAPAAAFDVAVPFPAGAIAVGPPTAVPTPPPAPVADGPVTLSGRCTDGPKPLAGIRVRLLKIDAARQNIEKTHEQTTDADGRFAFVDMPQLKGEDAGSYSIVAAAPGRASGLASHAPGFSGVDQFNFNMPPGETLRGRVTDESGAPIAGAKVWVTSPLNVPLDGVMSATTNDDGRYEIADLAPWAPGFRPGFMNAGQGGVAMAVTGCYLRVRHPDYGGRHGLFTKIPSMVDVTLHPAATIEGLVFDEVTGALAPGVTVSMQITNGPANRENMADSWQQTTTDARGRYRLTSVSAGKYNIWVDAKDRTCVAVDSLEATAGQKQMAPIIRLSEGGWIEGQVLDAAGKPMAKDAANRPITVALYGPSRPRSGAAVASVDVDAEGRYRLRAAPGVNFPYVMSFGGGFSGPNQVEVRAGQSTTANFRMGRGDALRPIWQPVVLPPIELPLPVEAEREAAAKIRELGGWYKLDDDQHVIEVNMVYHDGKGFDGQRRDNNQLTDAALAHVAAFPRLKGLYLKEGQATDQGLAHVRGVKTLERIFMWDAATVTDQGAAHLAELPNLKYIHLSQSQITDRAIELWKGLPDLYGLSLQGNRFTNAALLHAGQITKLRDLYLGNGEVSITDDGLVHLKGLASLESLDLQHSQVTDAGLVHLVGLGRLRRLSVSRTLVTIAGVAELKKSLPDLDERNAGALNAEGRSVIRFGGDGEVVRDEAPPRLAYLGWQLRSVDEGDDESPAIGAIWDAAGKEVDAETAAELRKLTGGPVFNQRPEDVGQNATGLVLWFEDDGLMQSRPVMPLVVKADGRVSGGASAWNRRVGKYIVSAAAPSMPFTWAATATLRIRFPTETPQVVKELRSIPNEPTQIDETAQWQGIVEPDGRLSSTLLINRGANQEDLVSFGVRLYKKDKQWPESDDGGFTQPQGNGEVTKIVGYFKLRPNDVDLVRISRQRSVGATIKDVPVRLDLMPN